MLKRMSLVFTLLMALVGIVGVHAQTAAQPQSMAQYVPADADIFFSIRTDGAFFDELSAIVNGVVSKLPPVLSAQASNLDLKTMIEAQAGPLEDTGLGDYIAVGVSNTVVLYDQDNSNDTEIVTYAVVDVADRAKFEAFFEKSIPNAEKSDEGGVTVYNGPEGSSEDVRIFVQDDVAYVTNQTSVPAGDMLSTSEQFTSTLAMLPEPSYNFVMYADFGPLFESMMTMMPEDSMEAINIMGMDLSSVGPVAVGGTVLDGKALVLDTYSSASSFSSMMPMSGPVDPEFASNIPAGFSFMVHGTDLKTSANALIEFAYKAQAAQENAQEIPSREQLNEQLKAVLGIDIDNDILGWMTGDYALVADMDMMSVLDALESGNEAGITLNPRFALIIEGDGSESPAKLAQVIGNLLVTQTENMDEPPTINLTTEEGLTTVVIEDVPVSRDPEILMNVEIAGNGDFFLIGDQETVDAILSGEGDRLSGDESFVDAQKYILPNASAVAYAGGDGWGDLISLGASVFAINSRMSTDDEEAMQEQTELLVEVLRSTYDIVSSSSVSVSYGEGGSQLSRIVLTLQ